MKENLKRKSNGITLIALIITIVMMLILLTITLTIVINSDLLNVTERAGEKFLQAKEDEEQKTSDAAHDIHVIVGDKMPIVSVNETATQNSTIDGELGSYDNPIIPKGFKAIDTETAKWNDEDGYKFGLVIEDDTKDPVTQGSQFVWVPVEKYEDFHLIESYASGRKASTLAGTNPVREAGPSTDTKLLTANIVSGTEESIAMYKSVKTYGGFFIARYEAGINGTTVSSADQSNAVQTRDGSLKPVSKAGVGVWNFIRWGGAASTNGIDGQPGDDRQDGAVKVARSMYNNPITGSVNSTTTVKSTLCYGVQYDAVLNFIDPNYVKGTCASDSVIVNATNQGNYSSTIAVTGSAPEYVHKNIYDIAGNMYEWTMEAYSTNKRVARGGSYNMNGGINATNSAASRRQWGGGIADNSWANVGFRVALYI